MRWILMALPWLYFVYLGFTASDRFYPILGTWILSMVILWITSPATFIIFRWVHQMLRSKQVGYYDYFDLLHGVQSKHAMRNFRDAFSTERVFGKTMIRARYRAGQKKASKQRLASVDWINKWNEPLDESIANEVWRNKISASRNHKNRG